MKTKLLPLLLITFLLATTTLLTSCEDDDKHSIRLDKETITISLEGGAETLTVTSTGPWQVKGVPEWMEVIPNSDDESGEITITATRNNGDEQRSAILVFTCMDASQTLTVTQLSIMELDPFIELDKGDLTMSSNGQREILKLTTNRSWEIKDIPSWLTVNPTSGDKSTEITFSTNEYREPESRTAVLRIIAGTAQRPFNVKQFGLSDYVSTLRLPIFPFERISFSDPLGKYEVTTSTLFVNPSLKDKVYMGNMLSHKSGSNTAIPEITGYTYNEITVSTSSPIRDNITSYVPSLEKQNEFVNRIRSQEPKQQISFTVDKTGMGFYSYKQLRDMGLTNLGINLDEEVTGQPYTQQEMTKKYGLIFSYKQVLFDLIMDYPEKLIKEELSAADRAKGVSYVSWVHYGRIGLLVVESDTDSRDVKDAINKVLEEETLTQKETNLIESADITHVYFNNDSEILTRKGGLNAVQSYKDAILNLWEYVYPVGFGFSDFAEHSNTNFIYRYDLSK